MKLNNYVLLVIVFTAFSAAANAKSKLSHDEQLLSSCQNFMDSPEHMNAKPCIYYIQGFIAGAVVTDTLNATERSEDENKVSAFSERAHRTRVGNANKRVQASSFMHFCVPGGASEISIVKKFSKPKTLQVSTTKTLRESVYNILKTEYPCA